MKIDFAKVKKSYNGRSGCMCGCRGTYKLPTHTSIEEANKATGYAAYDADNVSDRSVKAAIRKIEQAVNEEPEYTEITESYAVYDNGNRTSVVYFEL